MNPTVAAEFFDEVSDETLLNGIKIILRRRSKSPLTTFQIWYRVGSRNESVGRTGISHLLEHMMFKGTDKVGPEEFSRLIQREGGQTNAFTSKDFTAYFVIMSSNRIRLALELERDRILNLRLRKRDFEPERMVVMEERRLRTETQPEGLLMEEVEAVAYTSHPYRWPVIGWMEDLEVIGLKDVQRYWRRYYVPSNMLIVAVGDFSPGEMMQMLNDYFGDIPARQPPPAVSIAEPKQRSERRVILRRPAQVPYLVMAHHVPNLSHEDSYALEVLACLLGGGKSSRLYRRLVEEEMVAIDVEVHYPMLSVDPGLFIIDARILPHRSIQEVEQLIREELEHIHRGPLDEGELQKAKNQIEASFILALDNLFHQAVLLAHYEILGDWRLLMDYLPKIGAVTTGDIKRTIETYLDEQNRTVGWLIPHDQGQDDEG